jgi:hypothetical protein
LELLIENRQYQEANLKKLVAVVALAVAFFGSGISFTISPCCAAAAQHPSTAPSEMATSKRLVIEAEDLGMAHAIDRASFEALEKG